MRGTIAAFGRLTSAMGFLFFVWLFKGKRSVKQLLYHLQLLVQLTKQKWESGRPSFSSRFIFWCLAILVPPTLICEKLLVSLFLLQLSERTCVPWGVCYVKVDQKGLNCEPCISKCFLPIIWRLGISKMSNIYWERWGRTANVINTEIQITRN